MTFQLDHLIITVADLQTAVHEYQQRGYTVTPGGVHASGATHNALICFQDGSYLELLASTGQPPRTDIQATDFSSWLSNGYGLVGYALRSFDLDQDVALIRSQGIQMHEPTVGSRIRPDGKVLQWKSAFIQDKMMPFLIEDLTPRVWRVPDDKAAITHANGAIGISVVVYMQDEHHLKAAYFQKMLEVPSAKDSSNTVYIRLNDDFSLAFSPAGLPPVSLFPDSPHDYVPNWNNPISQERSQILYKLFDESANNKVGLD